MESEVEGGDIFCGLDRPLSKGPPREQSGSACSGEHTGSAAAAGEGIRQRRGPEAVVAVAVAEVEELVRGRML